MKSENYLRFFGIVLFAHYRTIAFAALTLVFCAAAVTFLSPPEYKARGSVIVKSKELPSQPGISFSDGRTLPPSGEDVVLETRIVTDFALIAETVSQLRSEGVAFPPEPQNPLLLPIRYGKKTLRKILGRGGSERNDHAADNAEDKRIAAGIKSNLSASAFPGSYIIDITLSYHDPFLAKEVLDRMLMNYPHFRLRLFADSTASGFYQNQVEHHRKLMHRYNQQLIDLMKKHSVSNANSELDGLMVLLNQASREYEELRDEKKQAMHRVKYLQDVVGLYQKAAEGQNVALPPPADFEEDTPNNKKLSGYLMAQYMEMQKFAATSPQSREIAGKIKNEMQNLISWERERIKNIASLLTEKEARLRQLKSKAINLEALDLKLQQVKTDAELTRRQYEAWSAKAEELMLELGTPSSQWANVQVLNRPSMPKRPSFPRPGVILPVALITGLILGLAFAWIEEFFDHTFKTPSQAEDLLHTPVIASILYPKSRR